MVDLIYACDIQDSGGSKGGAPRTRPPGVQILSFSCSFSQKIGEHTHFGSLRPL